MNAYPTAASVPTGEGRVASEPPDTEVIPLIALALTDRAVVVLGVVAALGLALGHPEHAETVIYLFALVGFLPLGIVAVRKQHASLGTVGTSTVALLTASATATVVVTARVVDAMEPIRLSLLVLLVGMLAIALPRGVLHVARSRWTPLLTRAPSAVAIVVLGALCFAAIPAFFPATYFEPARLLVVLLVGTVVLVAREAPRRVSPGRVVQVTVDVVALVLLALLVTDVGEYGDAFRYDYDFFLGPVIALEHGHPMLVETFSQYGVGLFYGLAAVFELVPLGYGGLQLVLCLGYILEFAVVYAVLRMISRSQLVAVAGLGLTLVASLAFGVPSSGAAGAEYVSVSHLGYPSIGPLRFGLPWVVVLGGTLMHRGPRPTPGARALTLATLAVSAAWSVETFAYAVATYGGVLVVQLAFGDGTRQQRRRAVALDVVLAGVVSFASLAALNVLTRLIAGAWPDWSTYLDLITLYGLEGFGALPISTWSTGYLVAAVYLASAVALAIAATRPSAPERLSSLIAIGGATAYGATSFTYFLGRSTASNLHHVAVPAAVVACGWWAMSQPRVSAFRRPLALATTAGVSWLGASLVAQSLEMTVTRLDSSTLAHVMRSPSATVSQARNIVNATPSPAPREGSRLIARHSNDDRAPIVLVRPDVLTSVLLVAQR